LVRSRVGFVFCRIFLVLSCFLTCCILKYTDMAVKTIYTTKVFDTWFATLRDKHAVRRIQARIDRAEDGNFGDCRPVGEGVSEMRIHFGPGYRIYLLSRGMEIVILLAGGDKSTQHKDIQTALETARQLKRKAQ
jgi:putative addiction module killer protein